MFFRNMSKRAEQFFESNNFHLGMTVAGVGYVCYQVGTTGYRWYQLSHQQYPSSFSPDHLSPPPRLSPPSLQIDSTITFTPYSHGAYCKKNKLNGICFGASLYQVIQSDSKEEVQAAILHEAYNQQINRASFNFNVEHYNPESMVISNMIAEIFKIKKEDINETVVESQGTSAAELKEFASRVVAKKESDTPFTLFAGVNMHDDTGKHKGRHALRFDFFDVVTDRCSFYDANLGKMEGPCLKVEKVFTHSLNAYYSTKARTFRTPLVGTPKNSSNDVTNNVSDVDQSTANNKLTLKQN